MGTLFSVYCVLEVYDPLLGMSCAVPPLVGSRDAERRLLRATRPSASFAPDIDHPFLGMATAELSPFLLSLDAKRRLPGATWVCALNPVVDDTDHPLLGIFSENSRLLLPWTRNDGCFVQHDRAHLLTVEHPVLSVPSTKLRLYAALYSVVSPRGAPAERAYLWHDTLSNPVVCPFSL